jgi:hypothetical protein
MSSSYPLEEESVRIAAAFRAKAAARDRATAIRAPYVDGPYRWLVALIVVLLMLLLAAVPAQAQLLVSQDDPTEPIWAVDVVTNQAQPVLSGFGAGAMAVDHATNTLYFMPNTVTLYRWDLDTPANPPTLIGTTNSGGGNVSLTGLAFDQANNRLIGARTLGSTALPEGFYEINTTNAGVSLVHSIANQSGGGSTYDFGGIDYDVATNRFYGVSDPTTSGGGTSGLFHIDLTSQQLNLLAPLPSSADPIPDIDGLAVGGGVVFLIEDRAVQTGGRVHRFNLTSNTYETPMQTPWFFNEIFAGATYIPNFEQFMSQVPEPASAGALALLSGIAALLRRRRR